MKHIEEKIAKIAMQLASLAILAMLLYILFVIIRRGLPSLSWEMISQVPSGGFYLGKEGGVLNAIAGSVYLILGAVLLSMLISIPAAMYINFYLSKKSRFALVARFTMDILFGIPSIVYGAFGFMLMIALGIKASLLGGIITMAFLITPIMIRSIDEVAVMVPRDLIEAPKVLGATRYETIKVVVRQLLPGISTAILLAIGRGIGDAATVLFTAGYTDNVPHGVMEPAASLPLAIFFQLGSPIEEVQNRAYASALILTIIILALSFTARFFSRKFSKNSQ
ncbi:PstA family ABC transporter permease [Alistipes sp. ZOR0009]|jgi:phosphate transport system permease protein|uniref:PstA family ABC transporter permease n=1 Tax=Alistipes sp. ZOR0009 TaxID=1339253 RepID=UPI00064580DC|nr:ABC transporter permease subunit [Alistipes sp. ZOR0009]